MSKHAPPERQPRPKLHQLHHFAALEWRVMRCTCKGWVLTTHPCRHCITTALVKYRSAQRLRTKLHRQHRPASHHYAVADAGGVQLHQMAEGER
jgi:hypothetical protein